MATGMVLVAASVDEYAALGPDALLTVKMLAEAAAVASGGTVEACRLRLLATIAREVLRGTHRQSCALGSPPDDADGPIPERVLARGASRAVLTANWNRARRKISEDAKKAKSGAPRGKGKRRPKAAAPPQAPTTSTPSPTPPPTTPENGGAAPEAPTTPPAAAAEVTTGEGGNPRRYKKGRRVSRTARARTKTKRTWATRAEPGGTSGSDDGGGGAGSPPPPTPPPSPPHAHAEASRTASGSAGQRNDDDAGGGRARDNTRRAGRPGGRGPGRREPEYKWAAATGVGPGTEWLGHPLPIGWRVAAAAADGTCAFGAVVVAAGWGNLEPTWMDKLRRQVAEAEGWDDHEKWRGSEDIAAVAERVFGAKAITWGESAGKFVIPRPQLEGPEVHAVWGRIGSSGHWDAAARPGSGPAPRLEPTREYQWIATAEMSQPRWHVLDEGWSDRTVSWLNASLARAEAASGKHMRRWAMEGGLVIGPNASWVVEGRDDGIIGVEDRQRPWVRPPTATHLGRATAKRWGATEVNGTGRRTPPPPGGGVAGDGERPGAMLAYLRAAQLVEDSEGSHYSPARAAPARAAVTEDDEDDQPAPQVSGPVRTAAGDGGGGGGPAGGAAAAVDTQEAQPTAADAERPERGSAVSHVTEELDLDEAEDTSGSGDTEAVASASEGTTTSGATTSDERSRASAGSSSS